MASKPSTRREAAAEMRNCRDCHQSIPVAARKCPACQSHQNWERYLHFGVSVLSLPVALVAVLSVTLPAAVKRLRLGAADPTVYYLAEQGGRLSIAVENKGWSPLIVEDVKLLPESFGVTPIELPMELDNSDASSRVVRDGDVSVITMTAKPEDLKPLQRAALVQLLARKDRGGDGNLLAREIVSCKLAVGSHGLRDRIYLTLVTVEGCRLVLSRLYGAAIEESVPVTPAGSASPP